MQTGALQQVAQISATPVAHAASKRANFGMNLPLDSEKNRSNVGAVGRQNNRKPKYQKQVVNKRESSSNRSCRKPTQSNDLQMQKRNRGKDVKNGDNLLNFHYASSRGHASYNTHGQSTRRRHATFNKEAFLQANCKFVVDYNEENYMVHTIDPDVLVDWDLIQLVYLPTHESPKCPICLYPPCAAKMTRCGHVFCWSCILHYLNLGEKTWRKCPICHESVHEKDLKSVIPIIQQKFSRIDSITMKLMKRSKGSSCATRCSEWDPEKTQFPIWEGQSFHSSSKLMLASTETVLEKILMREKIELTAQLNEVLQEQTGEESFVQMAMVILQGKLETYSSVLGKSAFAENIGVQPGAKNEEVKSLGENNNVSLAKLLLSEENNEKVNAFSEDEAETETEKLTSEEVVAVDLERVDDVVPAGEHAHNGDRAETNLFCARKERSSDSSSSDGTTADDGVAKEGGKEDKEDVYYFYQAEDGQNIFINSLNARCLIEEYSSLGNGPDEIVGQILDFEYHTMTKDLRKRFRYLSHLPISCEFIICELMLRPPILSKHTIQNFMAEFKKRKALRAKKTEEQKKFDMKANAELSREAGYRVSDNYYSEVQLDLSDVNDFPSSLSPDDLDNQHEVSTSNQPITATSCEEPHVPHGPSFAQMLKGRSMKFSASSAGVAWGQTRHKESPVYSRDHVEVRKFDENDDEDGPNIVAPTLREMFSAAMVTQPLHNSISEHGTVEGASKPGKGKKKKKTKGTLLFATGAQRKY